MSTKKHDEWPNLEADPKKVQEPNVTADPTGEKSGNREDLTAQFQELGQRLVSTARSAWQSEQRQELQQEITDGLRTVRDQLTEAVDNARASARNQNVGETVKEQVGKASETLRSNDLLDELRNGLATGLRELNEQLQRISERLERRGDAPMATAAGGTATDVTPTPAATPEVDQLMTTGGSGTAPSVELAPERQGDLPKQPEGPSTVEKL
ncbi:MAG TPA: hypothetical protein VIL85_02760 [Thermomicrobiales bacterium]|jgi:uncharacterized membrane protein YccC